MKKAMNSICTGIEVVKYIEELNAENLLEESLRAEKLYYEVANEPSV